MMKRSCPQVAGILHQNMQNEIEQDVVYTHAHAVTTTLLLHTHTLKHNNSNFMNSCFMLRQNQPVV